MNITDIQTLPTPIEFISTLDTSTLGTETNIDLYNSFVRPSFTNIVGSSTVDDGGYIGRMIKLLRVYVNDMQDKQELTAEQAGLLVSNMIPHIFNNALQFEESQLKAATDFVHSIHNIESIAYDIKLKELQYKDGIYRYENISPLEKAKIQEDIQRTHSEHLHTTMLTALENMKAGGSGLTTDVDYTSSVVRYDIDNIKANSELTAIKKALANIEAGGNGVDNTIDYTKTMTYLKRKAEEVLLGDDGNGIDLTKSVYRHQRDRAMLDTTLTSITAGGNGSDILFDYTKATPYLESKEISARLGDTGDGINLSNSVYYWQNYKAHVEGVLESVKAGGDGTPTNMVNVTKSIPYFQNLEIAARLGDRGNGIDLDNSVYKWESVLTQARAALESIKAGGNGNDIISNRDTSIAHFQNLEISARLGDRGNGIDLNNSIYKWESDRAKVETAIKSIEAGGNGNDILVDVTRSTPYLRNMDITAKLGNITDNIATNMADNIYRWQTEQAKYQNELTHMKAISEHIITGGNGDLSTAVNPDEAVVSYEKNIKKYQAIIEAQKAGEYNGVMDINNSSIKVQTDSMKEQISMFARQREAFDDRKTQSVLETVMKYNMMVFPDNPDAANQIPTTTSKTSIDSIVNSLLGV